MTLNPYALSLLATAVISGSLALYVWLRRAAPGGAAFAMVMAAVAVWSIAYGLELASTELGSIRFWVPIEYIGIGAAPVFWLLFTLHYSGRGDRLTPPLTVALFVIPALTVLLNATNERLHFLHYSAVSLDTSGPFPLLVITPGPWYWIHTGYAYACVLGGALVLARSWVETPRLFRGQVSVLLLGACLPLAVNFAYILGIRPMGHIDVSPLAFTATGLIVTFGIFRYSLFDLTPVVRNSLFENLRDPVLVIDAGGRLADYNVAAAHILAPDLGRSLGAAIDTALAQWPSLAALCAAGGVEHDEIRLGAVEQTYDGIGTPLRDRRGRYVGRMVVLRDITERRRAEAERLQMERQVQHTQKLESLGVLAGGIAHDFNNLLMAILGNLDLARFDMRPDHPAQEPLGDAERAARRAADLTRQLLAYAGKGAFVVLPVDLSRLVEEIAQLLQVSVGKMIAFDLRLDPALPVFDGDATQIQQIVLNLITNASEAIGGRSGTITLSTGVCQCAAEKLSRSRLTQRPAPGPFVFLTVADTGAGMDAEAVDRLFEPFYTTKQYGRGLGMAAVLGIVRSHGGAITVESEPGAGTTVTVMFPLTGVEAEGVRAALAPLAPLG